MTYSIIFKTIYPLSVDNIKRFLYLCTQNMKVTKTIIIAILLTAGLLAGCGDSRTDQMLSSIDTLMNNHPDSALQMLDSLKSEKPHWSKSQRMRYDLLHLKAENKAFVPLTSDSVAQALVSYYDTWGNANERMMAHYLLGCLYRDMGEAPQATEAYLDAIAQADTTSRDCDYKTLFRIYAQMATLYHKQLLLSEEIEARKQVRHYALLAKDTFNAIFALDKSISAYILLNKKDDAELLQKEVLRQYMDNGYIQEALLSSTKLMYIYLDYPGNLPKVKLLMDDYEKKSNDFNRDNELSGSKRQYYSYKGQYYEMLNNLDSAEFYYRKVYYPNTSSVAKNPMYKGLLNVFTKRHQADSISKYAQLYCEVNDSSIAKKDQELTAQMAASYNYYRYQKEARENETKANNTLIALITILALLVITSMILWNRYQKIKKRKQQEFIDLNTKYQNATNEYNKNLRMLQILDNAHQGVIANIQEELDRTKDESSRLSELNAEYESEKTRLEEENSKLAESLKTLERQKGLPNYLEHTQLFMETEIVRCLKTLEMIPLSKVTEANWTKLTTEVASFFPQLLNDLNLLPKMTKQKIRVCLLVILKIQDSCIANWLNLKASRISNIKSELNKEMFNDCSARTIYNNLRQKYNILSNGK